MGPISFPDLEAARQYGGLELWARHLVEGFLVGLHRSPYHGFSVEFSEYRPYQPGDPLRDIDWKVLARTDRLYIKKYEEETNLRCQILIDASSSMFFPAEARPTKFSYSAFMAAALLYLLRKQRDAAGLTLFADEMLFHQAPSVRLTHFQTMMARLEQMIRHPRRGQKTRIARALEQVNAQLPRRSMIIVFSDAFSSAGSSGALLESFKYLRSRAHDVIFFHTLSFAEEVRFDFDGSYLRMEDLETGQRIHLSPAQYRKDFRRRMHRFLRELKIEMYRYGVDYVPVDIQQGPGQVLLPFLDRRTRRVG